MNDNETKKQWCQQINLSYSKIPGYEDGSFDAIC